jgi:hypothetical protein
LPYFFLASCPDEQLARAVEVVRRHGGFHCVGPGPDYDAAFASMATGTGSSSFAAWKGKAEGQFIMLRDLSPEGRKVVCVAVAGFGTCNEERAFLQRLGQRAGHHQLELKTCGDVDDMERWLMHAGYRPTQVLGLACKALDAPPWSAESAMATTAKGHLATAGLDPGQSLWNSMTTLFAGDSGPNVKARRERLLADVHMVMRETAEVDTKSAEALRRAKDKLALAIRDAVYAGVAEKDLEDAEEREVELQRLLAGVSSCWCFLQRDARCSQGQVAGCSVDASPPICRLLSWSPLPAPGQQPTGSPGLETHAWAPNSSAIMPLASIESQPTVYGSLTETHDGRLAAGTRCSYLSSSRAGFIDAVVQGWNEEDFTYDLDVRPHARLEHICPPLTGRLASPAEAWAPGTLVEYWRGTENDERLSATVLGFNQGEQGEPDTYDLDVREHAPIHRIRARHM